MTTATPPLVDLDFLDPDFVQDPHATLHRVRTDAPVGMSPLGMWLLTRYDDVAAVNKDPRLGRDITGWAGYPLLRPFLADSSMERIAEQWIMFLDGDDHTRIRKLVARAFTPRAVAGMRATVAHVVDDLLGQVGTGRFDVMSTFAFPFPVQVIAGILGLPVDHVEELKECSRRCAMVVEPALPRRQQEIADEGVTELARYLEDVVTTYGARPDTILGTLLDSLGADGISDGELVANLVLLFVAGHETTTNLLGNGLYALLRNPDQLARLRAEPDLVPSAIEEMLRFESPVNVSLRVPSEPVEVGGHTIGAGELVFPLLGAANRDPAAFADPDRFDVARDPNRHLSFGGGAHYCVGASLARIEGEVALRALLERFDRIELASEPRWRPLVNLRGLEELVVDVQAA